MTEHRPDGAGLPPLRWHRTAPATGPGEGAADAPTFLLVHGVGLSHRSFSRLASVLAPHGTVLAPDLPGHGRAPGAGRRTTIDEIAASVAAGLAARLLGSGPVVVLGHSLGAEVATAVARQRPELVHGLVLVGPVVDPAAPTAVGQGLRLARDMLVEPPLTAVMVGREYVHCGPVTYGAGVRSMLRWSTLDGLDGLEVPLLVVRGARDPIAPTRWAEQLRARVDDGTVLEVPRAVHNLVHSHPEEVGGAVLALAARLRRP